MRNMIVMLSAAACALSVGGAAFAQTPDAPPAAPVAPVVSCDAHVFETSIQTVTSGKVHTSKVKICGDQGQSDPDWAVTLKAALDKVETNPKMQPEVKTQIAVALKSEIATVETRIAASSFAPVVAPALAPAPPPAVAAPVTVAPPPVVVATRPLAVPPHLSIECYTPGDIGSGGPCLTLQRDTVLTVRADADMGAAARLRFVRRDDARGEIAIPAMRKGQSTRFKMPAELCKSGAPSSVLMKIDGVGGGAASAAETRGPFVLRC